MIFGTKEDKINRIEKDMHGMEKRMEHSLQKMNETIKTLNDIILRLQRENVQLRSERDFLVERHKKMLRRVPVPDLALEINEKFVKPSANKIKENSAFVQNLAREGFVELKDPVSKDAKRQPAAKKDPVEELKESIIDVSSKNYGKSIDNLFEIVNKAGKIRADEAARKLGVHEIQVEEWAKILEDHEMVTIKKSSFGKMEISKL